MSHLPEGTEVFYNGISTIRGRVIGHGKFMVEVKWDDGDVELVHAQYLKTRLDMAEYAGNLLGFGRKR